MKPKHIFGEVRDGELLLDQDRLEEVCQMFNGKRVKVNIEVRGKKRSIDQNAYYWLLIDILGKHLGYDKDDMHEICRFKFLYQQDNRDHIRDDEPGTLAVGYLKSTRKLTKLEFKEYVDSIIRWAATEFNVELPDPDDR